MNVSAIIFPFVDSTITVLLVDKIKLFYNAIIQSLYRIYITFIQLNA